MSDSGVRFTVGMAVYDDFDGVYFTVQALRLYQALNPGDEILVVDNNNDPVLAKWCQHWRACRYVQDDKRVGTAYPRQRIFELATGDAVIVLDPHVLLWPGALARLRDYYNRNPATVDLLQGPLVYDAIDSMASHMRPVWQDKMWGVWAYDDRAADPNALPFEIPMQGLGLFSCRREVWPGFNPKFRGFGGEEGYIHAKFALHGGRCLCLPWLRWLHRFQRSNGARYPNSLDDRVLNYLLGHLELDLPVAPVLNHFKDHIPLDALGRLLDRAQRELAG